jgi:serine O-acetyltransferase
VSRLGDHPLARDIRHQLDNSFYIAPVATTPIRLLRLMLTPELQGTAWYRFSNLMWRSGFRRLAFLPYLRAKRLGCDISPEATIGGGLRIVHAMDIVIGPGARVGRDVVIFNGVTLGNRLGTHGENGMPRIGDRVLIGAGAKIIGPVAIGDGARIGAGAIVLIDVPAGATAAGNPARIVRSDAQS